MTPGNGDDPRDDLAHALKLAEFGSLGFVKITRGTAQAALAALNHRTQCHACQQRGAEPRTTELL